jgi:hypothetical protein
MSDSFEAQDWVRTGVAAAMLRSLDGDSQQALEATAKLLTSTLPNRTKLETKGLFSKKLIKVTVTLGEDLLSLETDIMGTLIPSRVHTSRGIALKRQTLPLEEWIATLVDALEEKAQSDSAAREALEKWLGNV